MVRKFTALFALVLALGMAIMPAAAQDTTSEEASDIGLESGYARAYAPKTSAATPESMNAEATPTEVRTNVLVAGFQFDSADNAEAAFELFSCGFAGGITGATEAQNCDDLADSGLTVNQDLEISGDKAIEISGEADNLGGVPMVLLSIQSDNYLFMVITVGTDEPGSSDAIGSFLADAEPVDTEVVYNKNGTSTGGFFDMLPQEGDDVLDGLVPTGDENFEDVLG